MALTKRQERLNARYEAYLAAEEAVLTGQSYTIGNRQLTRANLADIYDILSELEALGCPFEDDGAARRMSKRAVLF